MDIPDYVSPCSHVALDGFGLRDVDDGVEEVGFAMLATEILNRWGRNLVRELVVLRGGDRELKGRSRGTEREERTNSTDDCVMTREMGLATLAAKDFVRV